MTTTFEVSEDRTKLVLSSTGQEFPLRPDVDLSHILRPSDPIIGSSNIVAARAAYDGFTQAAFLTGERVDDFKVMGLWIFKHTDGRILTYESLKSWGEPSGSLRGARSCLYTSFEELQANLPGVHFERLNWEDILSFLER